MDRQRALHCIMDSLRDGADLRNALVRDYGDAILEAAELIVSCLRAGGKVLFFGNGGSAADAQHLAAEFVGRFVHERPGLPAIALTTDSSILTAIGNDYGFDRVFARQVEALATADDVVVAISTSGNSPNVIEGVKAAKERNLKAVVLSGKNGGALAQMADVTITVPSTNTARIQECHITIGHIFCELVDHEFSGGKES